MTFYVEGLMPNIRTIVAQFRENEFCHDMTFERLIQFEKDEGDAARARIEALRPTGTITSGILKPTKRSPPPPRTLSFYRTDRFESRLTRRIPRCERKR